MSYGYTGGREDLIVDSKHELVGFHGRKGDIRLLTTEQVRQLLGYGHVRHIYWLVEQGHLPFRKFGRELVFTGPDVQEFRQRRGG